MRPPLATITLGGRNLYGLIGTTVGRLSQQVRIG
jgi:hypothetical protein